MPAFQLSCSPRKAWHWQQEVKADLGAWLCPFSSRGSHCWFLLLHHVQLSRSTEGGIGNKTSLLVMPSVPTQHTRGSLTTSPGTAKSAPVVSRTIRLVDSILKLTTLQLSHFNSWMAGVCFPFTWHRTAGSAVWRPGISACKAHASEGWRQKKPEWGWGWGGEQQSEVMWLNKLKWRIFRLFLFQTGISGKALRSGSLQRVVMNAGCVCAALTAAPEGNLPFPTCRSGLAPTGAWCAGTQRQGRSFGKTSKEKATCKSQSLLLPHCSAVPCTSNSHRLAQRGRKRTKSFSIFLSEIPPP